MNVRDRNVREKLLLLDAHYSQQLSIADNPGLLRNLARFFAHSADSWFWLIGLAIVWLAGDAAWRQEAVIMAAGILITAAVVFTIKFIVRRERPEGDWGAVYRKTDPNSFPSGHATRAVMLMVLAIGLGPPWLAVILVIWAPLVVLARVAMGVHYLSDVLAGGVLGLGLGLLLLKFTYWILPLL